MKTNKLKWIALTLSALFLLQSCRVYHSKSVTVDEAILSAEKVKLKNFNEDTFKFDKLQKEDGQLYGIARRGSKTAQLLSEQIVNEIIITKYQSSGKFVKILLLENTIKEYHLTNNTLSALLTIGFPFALVGVFFGLILLGYIATY